MSRHRAPRSVALPDGRILSFAFFGDPAGRPVLALHGTTHAHPIWALADGAARRRGVCLIAPDRPGYGASTAQPDRSVVDGPADLAVLAEAVYLDDLAVLTVGGGFVYGLAAAHCLLPRVRRLAVVAPGEAEPTPRAALRLGRDVRRDPEQAAERLLAARPLDRALLGEDAGWGACVASLRLAFADPGAAALDARLRGLAWGREQPTGPMSMRRWDGSAYAWLSDLDLVLRWLTRP
jgi:hypothetical protein